MTTTMKRALSGRMHLIKMRCAKFNIPHDDAITVHDLYTLFFDQGFRCVYCRYPIYRNFRIDHTFPVSRGGWHVLENLQFTCFRCNSNKSNLIDPPTADDPFTDELHDIIELEDDPTRAAPLRSDEPVIEIPPTSLFARLR